MKKLVLISVLTCSSYAFAASSAKSPFDLEIPPPDTIYPPVLKVLPQSLPQYQSISVSTIMEEPGLNDRGLLPMVSRLKPQEPIRVFATDGSLNTIGNLIEAESESGLPIAAQYFYVKIKSGEAKVLDKLLIVNDKGPLIKIQKDSRVPVNGNYIKINAEIQLTNEVEAEDPDEGFTYYRARIIRAIDLSESGNGIIRGKIEVAAMDANGPRSSVVADIVGGENEERSGLFGTGNFVFLNRGSNEGLKVGDVLPIYVNRRLRNSNTPFLESPVSEGLLKIVHVDSGISTALIVKATDGIRQGDKTGALARNITVETQTESVEDYDLTE